MENICTFRFGQITIVIKVQGHFIFQRVIIQINSNQQVLVAKSDTLYDLSVPQCLAFLDGHHLKNSPGFV